MSFTTALRSFLLADSTISSLVGIRVFPEFIQQASAKPYISFFRVSSIRYQTMDGTGHLVEARIQFECVDDNPLGREALSEALRKRLDGFRGIIGGSPGIRVQLALLVQERDVYLDSIEAFGRSADYFIHYEEE